MPALDHPKGLFICFGTELWERFSYYGMRALLIFYLTQHYRFSDQQSYGIYGAYTALAWGLPVIGGILADRYLGSRKAVTLGAVLLACGHLLLAVEGPPAMEVAAGAVTNVERHAGFLNLFYLSLALIVSGVGFLKGNIAVLVGSLYGKDDPRRDTGFTIFYLGINLGAASAPLLCGWLGQTYGWRYGFGLAGIGMLAGLLLFLWGQRYLPVNPDAADRERHQQRVLVLFRGEQLSYLGALAMVLVAWQLLQHAHFMGASLSAFGTALASAILYFSLTRCAPVERDRMVVVTVLIVFSILFWSLYEQMGSSLNLYADRLVDRSVLGFEIQAAQLQALPGIFVIAIAPLFVIVWTSLGRANPSIPVKFALGLALIGVAFTMPVIGAELAAPGEKIGLFWYAMVFFLMVCGELCIAPIAMNMITQLCPERVISMMMGAYLLSLSIGSFIASQLAKLTSIEPGSLLGSTDSVLSAYTSSFKLFALIGVSAGALLYMLSPLLHSRMHIRGRGE